MGRMVDGSVREGWRCRVSYGGHHMNIIRQSDTAMDCKKPTDINYHHESSSAPLGSARLPILNNSLTRLPMLSSRPLNGRHSSRESSQQLLAKAVIRMCTQFVAQFSPLAEILRLLYPTPPLNGNPSIKCSRVRTGAVLVTMTMRNLDVEKYCQ